MIPLGFFIWVHLKFVVFGTPPHSSDDLSNRIIEECKNLTTKVFKNLLNAFENRLYYGLSINRELLISLK